MRDTKNRRLNILFVADVSINKVIGGAERVLKEQSTRLAQRGHKVHILTRKLSVHEKRHEVIKGVNEWRYEYKKSNTLFFLHNTWTNGKRLFEYLHNKYNFDCINFQQPFSAIGIITSSLSKDISKIYTCLSFSFEEFMSRKERSDGFLRKSSDFFNCKSRKWIEKKVLMQSNKIIALSYFTKNKLFEAYKINADNISIIPGGIDLDRFHFIGKKFEIRKALKIPDDKVILLTVRNLVNRMGLENLIIALKDIVKNAPDIYLVIGGEGPLKAELIALTKSLNLREYIHFTGFIPEDKLPSFYQMADLFILPTKELEGFGLVTLEALACGLPVLGTPIGATKEILGRFDSEFIFDSAGPESMSKKIIEKYKIIKDNPLKWEEISFKCRDFTEKHYSWEKNVDSLEELFLNTSQN